MMSMKIRVLAPEEHEKIVGLGPFQSLGPDPTTSSVVVAEDESTGEILGYWCAFNAVHLEPLWVVEGHRGNGVGTALWGRLRDLLLARDVPGAFAMVADADVMTHLPLAARLGFQRIPASTLYVDLSGEGKGH